MPRLKPITGKGITTHVAMESADLGIMRWDDQRNAVAAMFGDNFEFWGMQGNWQSPSIVMYDNDLNVLGVPTKDGIDHNGKRKQLWEYPHNNPDYSTILPCDFIRISDWWYCAAMVTAGLGHEKRTVFWRSHDLCDWEKTKPYMSFQHLDHDYLPIGHPGNTMLTFDQFGEWIYIFGTGGLARDKPMWSWRMKAVQFPYGEWIPLNDGKPILDGKYGELCFRVIQNNCVLSFFDVEKYCMSAITVTHPLANWQDANRVDYAWGKDFPQLYGGYITPDSKLNEFNGMKFAVSQWNTSNNDPYHVVPFVDTLRAMGPLVEAPPKPTAPPTTPVTPPGGAMTPQELYELLLRELSASGSVKITTPEGNNITLREAIEQIFYKERGLHGLENRPRHPGQEDDQLGHVLSARGEGLFTQAVVVAIAEHLNISVGSIYEKVQESLA